MLALAEWPPLIEEKGLFPEDAIDRGKRILAESSGSIGAYSHSQGLKIIREAVISFIKSRDLVGFQARSSCLSHEAQSSIRDAQNTNSSSKANTNDKYPFNHNKIEKKLVNKLDQMDLTFDGEISANDIFLCNGASEGVRMALQILIADKKSAIMIPYPQYPLYSALINVIGGQIIPYALDESNGWSIDTKGLEEIYQSAIKDGFIIRGFVLINPGNPTGSYFEPEVIEDVMKFCKTHDITLMADEVYQSNIHLPNKKFISCLQILIGLEEKNSSFREQTLLSFHSVSKGLLGECGHRGGYMHCYNLDPLVREQLYKLASISLCPNLPGQLCVWLMVDPPSMGDPSYILFENECRSIREALARKASYLHDRLTEMEGITCQIATGALYLYPRIQLPLAFVNHCDESKSPDTAYALELLSATGICVVPGSGFGQVSYFFQWLVKN